MALRLTSFLLLICVPLVTLGAEYRLCVSRAEEHHENKSLIEALGITKPDFEYSIQVNDGPKRATNPDSGFEYPLTSPESRQLVKIERAGKLAESFWIDFDKYETDALCLWFKPLYETWSVWELGQSKHLCDCPQ